MTPRTVILAIAAALGLTLSTAPAIADGIPPAPDLARDSFYQSNVMSVVLDGTVDDVRNFMDQNPLTDFLEPTGNIPRIADVVVLNGTWGDVGSLRRVDLEGGFHVHERVLSNDNDEFTYQIWDITTPAGRYINHIYGEIRFSAGPDGAKLTWSYNIKPRFFFARPSIRSYLNNDFQPFMENGLSGFAQAFNAQSS